MHGRDYQGTRPVASTANIARAALPVAELAERMGIEAPPRSPAPETAHRRRLGDVRPGADSRQRIVTITDAGLAKVREAFTVWLQAQTELEHLLGRDTVQALHAQLDSRHDPLTP